MILVITNGLYILGDPRITKVIEDHQDEILLNPDWMDGDGDNSYTESVKLAPLPAQLSILNGLTMKCVLRGILKDFGLTFKSRKPAWWPTHIPFESVTTAPEGFEGIFIIVLCYVITIKTSVYVFIMM